MSTARGRRGGRLARKVELLPVDARRWGSWSARRGGLLLWCLRHRLRGGECCFIHKIEFDRVGKGLTGGGRWCGFSPDNTASLHADTLHVPWIRSTRTTDRKMQKCSKKKLE